LWIILGKETLTINYSILNSRCNDLLKNQDNSKGSLSTRLSAIRVLGTMYEKLGRMTGRSFEETIGLLNKGWKNAESSSRAETMLALGIMIFIRGPSYIT